MGKKKSTTERAVTNQVTNQTSTPTTPAWMQSGFQDLFSRIGAFGNTDAAGYVAPTSPLQQQAFSAASKLLGGGDGGVPQVNGGPGQAYGGKVPESERPQINPGPGGGGMPGGVGAGGIMTGGGGGLDWESLIGAGAGMATRAGNADANTATATGYNPAGPAGVSRYNAATYDPTQAVGQGYSASTYDPALLSGSAQVWPVAQGQASSASAAGLLDGGLDKYLNPYQSQVTDAYSADFDQNAGRTRAAQAAQAAASGAFSGSRYGVQEAQTEGELARARASGLGSILQGGFDRATGLADSDANRRQSANLTNAQLGTQASLANAASTNQASLAQAGFNQQGLLANLDSRNQAGQFNAGANNTANQFTSGLLADLSRFNADSANQAGQFNAGSANRASEFGASADNVASLDAVGRQDSAGQFNADAANRNSQFNAGQQETALGRQLQASGLLGDLGNSLVGNQRANIGLASDLGAQQRGIDASQRTAELSQLQALAQLYGSFPSQLFTGQQTNGTVNGTNTTTQTQNPGLLGSIGQGAQVAGSLAALFSDERLKTDIVRIGEHEGMGVYRYNYIWGGPAQVGVLAQEAQRVRPDAVTEGPGGFLMVDYGRL